MYHTLALSLAVLIDQLIGDPRWLPHPVIGFGKIIAALDRLWNKGRYRKLKGVAMLLCLLFLTVSCAYVVVHFAYRLHPLFGIAIESILIATTIAAKGLKEAGQSVANPLRQGDMPEARKKLSWIVGRDTDTLTEAEIARGTVETVAENTSDGVTAPLFFAFIGGAPLALLYRAVNTCDSMVGYKNEQYHAFGWASARLDDVLNYIPARLTGLLMLIVPITPTYVSFTWLRRQAKNHPSPNSGWCEAGVAGRLGIQLGGTNYYKGRVSHRPLIGEANVVLAVAHIEKTTMMMQRTVWAFWGVLIALGGLYAIFTKPWS
nr:adenosylcobinamide-phosphate synthase CbiB [Fictibacillus macauensis]